MLQMEFTSKCNFSNSKFIKRIIFFCYCQLTWFNFYNSIPQSTKLCYLFTVNLAVPNSFPLPKCTFIFLLFRAIYSSNKENLRNVLKSMMKTHHTHFFFIHGYSMKIAHNIEYYCFIPLFHSFLFSTNVNI
jgi:hypothetical protein